MTPPQKKSDRGLPSWKTILEIYTALPVMSCVAERNSSKLSIIRKKNFCSTYKQSYYKIIIIGRSNQIM